MQIIPFRQAGLLSPAPLSASFAAIPFRQSSPSLPPVVHSFCRYPFRSVCSISPLPFSASFADIPSVQFTTRLAHRFFIPFADIPSVQFTTHLAHRFFIPFAAIPFDQFTLPLPCAICTFADIPLSQLVVTSSCSRLASFLPQSPILNSRRLATVPGPADCLMSCGTTP